jgi:cell wall-associated NlpC family hydrolase
MRARERLGTKLVIGCMATATVLTAVPKAQGDDRPKAPTTEGVETKVPKKAKRKRSEKLATPGQTVGQSFGQSFGSHAHPFAISTWVRAQTKRHTHIDLVNTVLAVARKQLGKPYRYGSVGPSSFDCSGFTRFVYAAAGVHLPHNSSAQYASTQHVSLDKLKPGDLVFFPHHVGLYIGHGQMIHAPETGDHVRIAPLQGGLYGAGRPLPA